MENFEGEFKLYDLALNNIILSMTYVYYIFNTKKNKSDKEYAAYKSFLEKTAKKTFSSHREIVDSASDISPGLGSTTKIFEISKEFGFLDC